MEIRVSESGKIYGDVELQQYSHNVDTITYLLPRTSSSGADLSRCRAMVLTNASSDGFIDAIGIDMVVVNEQLQASWTPTIHTTHRAEELCYQLVLQDDNGKTVWYSEQKRLVVQGSIPADETITVNYPTLFQQWETQMNALNKTAEVTLAQAAEQAEMAKTEAGNSKSSANLSVEQAQAASLSQDTAAVKASIAVTQAETASTKASEAAAQAARAEQLVRQAESLLSGQPRSNLVKTLAERDALTDLRQCDRCDVVDAQATYIYDKYDVDGDQINPEWVLVSRWDSIKTVSWDIVQNKPAFAAVATSGSYSDLKNKPNRYESFVTLPGGNWDYSLSDKVVLTVSADTPLSITNVYNGAVGVIKVYGGQLILPVNSKKSVDFDYLFAASNQHYTYTFLYDGASFCWNRSVCQ